MGNKKQKIFNADQFTFGSFGELSLKVTVLRGEKNRGSILYFHGGGFLYGQRQDLPSFYQDQLLAAGFNLYLFDYPLAPEVDLTDIYSCAKMAVQWFLTKGWQLSGAESKDYFLFGRSSGGYLATLLTAHLPHLEQKGLIRFYGYQELFQKEFIFPSAYYNQFPKVSPLDAQELIGNQPMSQGSLEKRFPLYLSARQYGNWQSYLGTREKLKALEINRASYKKFPPCFLAHCKNDPDVPFSCSTILANLVPLKETVWLDLQQHDFDRSQNYVANTCYNQLIDWLTTS
jgi:acetyl esterase